MNPIFQTVLGILFSAVGLILTVASLLGGIDVPMSRNGGPAGGAVFFLLLCVGALLLLFVDYGETDKEKQLRRERNDAETALDAAKLKLKTLWLLATSPLTSNVHWNTHPHDREYSYTGQAISNMRDTLQQSQVPSSVENPEAFVDWLHDKLVDEGKRAE